MKKYKLILNRKQMQVLKDVCELRFRIDLLQGSDLAEILAQMDCLDLDPRNPDHKKIFDSYIERRDHINAVIDSLFEIASPRALRIAKGRKRDKTALIAEDIYLAVRHQLWKDEPRPKIPEPYISVVDSYPPLSVSDQGLPKIEVIDE